MWTSLLLAGDLIFLKQKAQENLKSHIPERLPEEYQRYLTGMNQVLKSSWQIANNNNGSSQDHIMVNYVLLETANFNSKVVR
jgi:hypothetical protein